MRRTVRILFAATALIGVSVLARPAAAGSDPPDGVLGEFPFLEEYAGGNVETGHIAIDLAKPGARRRMPMLLDTGADWSVMTPRAARAQGVSVRRVKSSPYQRSTALGRSIQFWVDTRSSDTGSRSGWELGLVGGQFLEHYVVELDYAAQRVRLLDPEVLPVATEPTRPDEIVVPLRIGGRRPYVQLELGSGSAWFLVDTGAPFDLEISEKQERKLGIEPDPDAEQVEGLNWIGRDRGRLQRVGAVRIGSHQLSDVGLLVTLRDGSAWRHTNQAGADAAVLGNAFLSRFHVRIDYPNERMSLTPVPADGEEGAAARTQVDEEPRPPVGARVASEG